MLDEKPRPDWLPITTEARHAFLYRWLPSKDPVVDSWERWFQRSETVYVRRDQNGYAQLFVHHWDGKRWCCRG